VLSPVETGAAESLLAPPLCALIDFFARRGGRRIVFGARPADVLRAAAEAVPGPRAGRAKADGGSGGPAAPVLQTQRAAAAGQYIVAIDGGGRVLVALVHGAGDSVLIRAYLHALYLARYAGAAPVAAPSGGRPRRGAAGGGGGGGAAQLLEEAERWMGSGTGCEVLLRDASAEGWRLSGPSLPKPAWTGKWT
jgi:hypothetical protein